jgi:hypothetical protein
VAGSYDEKALLQQVLEASKPDEDTRFPDLQEALTLTGMVALLQVSLPPPPPLPPHAPLLATYEGQEVLPGSVTTRTEWSSTLRRSPSRRSSSTSSSTMMSSWRRHSRWRSN